MGRCIGRQDVDWQANGHVLTRQELSPFGGWEAQRSMLCSHQESGNGKKATPCDDHRFGASKVAASSRLLSATWLTLGWVAVFAPGLQGCQISVALVGLETPWSEDPASSVDPGPSLGMSSRTNCMETTRNLVELCSAGKGNHFGQRACYKSQRTTRQRGWQHLVSNAHVCRTISSESIAIFNGIGRPADCRRPGPTATALMLDCRAACRDPSHHESDPVRGLGYLA